MIAMDRRKDAVEFTFYSSLFLIHEVVCEAEEFFRGCGINNTTRISIVLRELLSNAIWHGNRNIPSKSVRCKIERIGEKEFKIVVEDEGEGFDFARLDMALPDDPLNIDNRGYVLINSICSALEFNERGNRVTAYIDDFEQRLLQQVETLYAVALKLTHDPEEAEFITQSTLAEAWSRRSMHEDPGRLKSELLKILRHTFLNRRHPLAEVEHEFHVPTAV